jgi:hypothetical protein
MIWFWSREQQQLRVETRYDNETSDFVVAIEHPDGHQECERFPNLVELRKRLVALEQQFAAEHWTPAGEPLFVPDGFPNRPLTPEAAGGVPFEPGGRTITKRTYSARTRRFDITLSGMLATNESSWTIDKVIETSWGVGETAIDA